MKTITAAAVLGAMLLGATSAMATNGGGSGGSTSEATAGAVAGAAASASTQTLNENSLRQAQGQTQGQTNGNNDVNVDNSSNDKNWWSPALGGIPLASGSNAEMAPNSYSGGLTTPFGGLLFGWSEQQLTPSAIYTLADLGERASRKWQVTASANSKVEAEHIRNALCVYYRRFADAENLCDRDE